MNINSFNGIERDGMKLIIDTGEGVVLFVILFLATYRSSTNNDMV